METERQSRWPRRILIVLLGLAILYTAAWFAAAAMLERQIARIDHPLVDGCEDRTVTGFPLAIAVSCSRYSVEKAIKIGASRISAPLTDIGRVVLTFTAPAVLTPRNRTDGATVELTWSELSTATEMGLVSRELEDLSVTARNLLVRAGPHDVNLDTFDALVSEGSAFGGVAEDAAIRVDATALRAKLPFDLALPPVDLKLRATMRDGMAGLAQTGYRLRDTLDRGADFDVAQLSMTVPQGGQLVLAGPVTLGSNGLLSGRVQVGVTGTEALAVFAEKLGPQVQQSVAGLVQAVAAAGQPMLIDGKTLRSIEVTLDQGNVRLGFFSLGSIPPFRY